MAFMCVMKITQEKSLSSQWYTYIFLTLCDEAKDIWCAEGVDARFRQLYVNGKRNPCTSPNLNSDGSHNMFRLTKVDSMGRAFDVS